MSESFAGLSKFFVEMSHYGGMHHFSMQHFRMPSQAAINDYGNDLFDGRFVAITLVVMLLYDHVLTIGQEVDGIWKRKMSLVSVLFLVNRYLAPLLYVFVVVGLINPYVSWEFCHHVFNVFPPIVIVVSEAIIGVLFILRTKALWQDDLNYMWGSLVCILFGLQTVASVWTATGIGANGPLTTPFNMGCILFFQDNAMSSIRLAIYWLINIAFNLTIFLCTVRRTQKLRIVGVQMPLVSLLQRDGTIYFVCLLLVKLADLLMLLLYAEWNVVNWGFNHVVDVIITARLLLNLRIEARPVRPSTESTAYLQGESSPTFRPPPYFPPSSTTHEVILIGPEGDAMTLPSPLICSPATTHHAGRSPIQPSVEWMMHALYEVLGEEDYARVMRAAGMQPPPQRNATYSGRQRTKREDELYLAGTV